MNKITIIVESILAAAVVALFVIFFTVNPHAKICRTRWKKLYVIPKSSTTVGRFL